jgi:hypothetical protein
MVISDVAVTLNFGYAGGNDLGGISFGNCWIVQAGMIKE